MKSEFGTILSQSRESFKQNPQLACLGWLMKASKLGVFETGKEGSFEILRSLFYSQMYSTYQLFTNFCTSPFFLFTNLFTNIFLLSLGFSPLHFRSTILRYFAYGSYFEIQENQLIEFFT